MRSAHMRGALLLVALVTVAIAAAALVLATPARAENRFSDAAGDSGAAHDVTAVSVSNDATQVVLTFPVPNPFPNLRQADDQAWLLMIDADRNPSTGDGGEELRVFQKGGATVDKWNGSSWGDAPPNGISVRFELNSSSAGWRVQLPRELLGGTTGFDFRLVFAKFVGEEISDGDRAPDNGYWRYDLAFVQCANGRDDDSDGKIDGDDRGCTATTDDAEGDEPVTPQLLRPSVTPAKSRPGATVVVRARAQTLETGAAMETGSVVCTIRMGANRKRIPGRIAAGLATCRLTAPRLTRTTTVRGTMTMVGTSQSVPFSFRVA
jgi:hypothetical protein